MKLVYEAVDKINRGLIKKPNFMWLECTGCEGNIISFLNADKPDFKYFLEQMVNLKYSNSLMQPDGERAYENFLETLDTDFILGVEGALTEKDNGFYTLMAHYKGKQISAAEGVSLAAAKAKKIIAIGTCASFGGISAAKPNPTGCVSLSKFLNRNIINIPGCPANPLWVIGTIAGLILYGDVEVDDKGRPLMFYKETNHTDCERRSYFDNGIFAKKLGEHECMFKLGCRGPITKAYCPIGKWNSRINWPVEGNTPCIGCASEYFPDGTEPFVRY
ncbi:hydrogenase small subunit [Clostridium muellerianum]|nr:hydrogenase small subunit [Clostridium muellerianum]